MKISLLLLALCISPSFCAGLDFAGEFGQTVLILDIIMGAAIVFTMFFICTYSTIFKNQKDKAYSKKTVSVIVRYFIVFKFKEILWRMQ